MTVAVQTPTTGVHRGLVKTANNLPTGNFKWARSEKKKLKPESGASRPRARRSFQANLSNEDEAVYSIHDILKAYYKVAIKQIMDNVVVGVVERSWAGPVGFVGMFD
ncbi:hypothetical protein LTS03_011882, partial [Exophiala xenobiotica]